jgi:hypothetical protein
MESIIKNQKKKKKVLQLDFNCLTREDIIKTMAEIRKAVLKIFRKHIGRENSITPFELFYEVFGISPQLLDIWKRGYWWNVLKRIIIEMRREGDIFIINRGYFLFVLKTKEENRQFQDGVNRHIAYLEDMKETANNWVKNEKWRGLEDEQ